MVTVPLTATGRWSRFVVILVLGVVRLVGQRVKRIVIASDITEGTFQLDAQLCFPSLSIPQFFLLFGPLLFAVQLSIQMDAAGIGEQRYARSVVHGAGCSGAIVLASIDDLKHRDKTHF
uniref:Putative secreted protein n=1 Tax=Anopheles darlingi TaxID=43151 RepID=A0A2M4DDQ1_ANODA